MISSNSWSGILRDFYAEVIPLSFNILTESYSVFLNLLLVDFMPTLIDFNDDGPEPPILSSMLFLSP